MGHVEHIVVALAPFTQEHTEDSIENQVEDKSTNGTNAWAAAPDVENEIARSSEDIEATKEHCAMNMKEAILDEVDFMIQDVRKQLLSDMVLAMQIAVRAAELAKASD